MAAPNEVQSVPVTPDVAQSSQDLKEKDLIGADVRQANDNCHVSTAPCSSGESSMEVKGREEQNHRKTPVQQPVGKIEHPEDDARTGIGSSDLQGQPSGQSSQQSASSSSSQASYGHSTGKKAQTVSGNHLLNFHYARVPFPRSQPRAPPPRRQQKRKPYNKDLFFQANYKFVVLDSGNYAAESMDPDKMLCWEDIICLKYSTPSPIHCPICLDDPLCPQITTCGHIFCFPCILQYFSMYEGDLKSECWKKCPLCFTMICSKDLYTIQIENVKQYHIGDEVEFVLLTRQKSSFSSSIKNNERTNGDKEILDSFSKFILTSDVELSVRDAMSDLDSWIARADSGLVDDIEKLPYVSAAIEQLEQRKKYWNEHRISNGNKVNSTLYGSPPSANAAKANYTAHEFVGTISSTGVDKSNWFETSSSDKVGGEYCPQVSEFNESVGDQDRSSSSSYDDNKSPQKLFNVIKERKDGDAYNFYQAIDGQHLILHPVNMRCLLHHYGSNERLPSRITGKILQLETETQSEAIRQRYRFLSHFSLATTFQFCEIDLSGILPAESLAPFMDEIKNREKQRKLLAEKELKDKIKAETAGSQFAPAQYYSYNAPPSFSMEDFEALGAPAVASSSSPPTIGERQSFSSVARLGFAAAHDSPVLKIDENDTLPKTDLPHQSSSTTALGAPAVASSSSPPTIGERQSFSSVARLGFAAAHDSPVLKIDEKDTPPNTDLSHQSSGTTGWKNTTSASFANIASRSKPVEVPPAPKPNEVVGKKGKKPSRVLLSTAGGRRY